MNRRSILLGFGTAAAGAGAVFGSGAFTQVQADRDLTVRVDEDSNALLGITAGSNVASVYKDSGELAINTDKLSDETGEDSQGFAVGSTVDIGGIDNGDVSSGGEAFSITNNFDDVGDGNANLEVGIDLTSIDLSEVSGLTSLEFYGTTNNGNGTQVTSAGGRNVFDVTSGDTIRFAIRFTTASTTGPQGLDSATVTFQAGSDLTSDDFPTAQPVNTIVRDSDGASFNSIQNAINADGTGTDETLRVGAGTYDESVTIGDEGLTLEAGDGPSPTITQDSGTVIDVNADDVTVDGLTIEAGDGTTAVDIDGVSDSAIVTLTNNTIDLTTGNADSVGIQTGSGSTVEETIDGNTFEGLVFDTEFQDFVDDSAERVDLDTIVEQNTFNPSEVTASVERIAASESVENAETVSSDTELRDQLDDSNTKSRTFNIGAFGETLALDSSYVETLNDSAFKGIGGTARGFYQVNLEQVNTDNAKQGTISAAYILGDGSVVTHAQATVDGSGDVYVFIPEAYQGKDITLVVGNVNQSDDISGEWADLDVSTDDYQVVHIENLGN